MLRPACLPAVLGDYHLVGELLKSPPQFTVVQGHVELPLRGVALLAAHQQLTLHGAEEVVHPLGGGHCHSVQELQGSTEFGSNHKALKPKGPIQK